MEIDDQESVLRTDEEDIVDAEWDDAAKQWVNR